MGNRPPQSSSGHRWPRDVRDLFRSARRNHGNGEPIDTADATQLRSNGPEDHASGQRSSGSGTGKRSWRDKLNSCPDLQKAATRGCQQQQHQQQHPDGLGEMQPTSKLNYKIYRSYSDLPPEESTDSAAVRVGRSSTMVSCADNPVIEVRVYRRSTETLSVETRRKTQSLPRGMDLRRSLGSDLAGAATTGSGSSGDSRRGSTSMHSSSHYTDVGGYSRSTSRKASARSSMASIGARVTVEEFPDNVAVRRKVEEFERNFVTTFVDAFKCLAPLNQLAALSVATRPDHANQAVSLLQYLESDTIPVDIATDTDQDETTEYCLTIAPSRFPEVQRLKVEGAAAIERRLAISHQLAEDMSRDAASELSRMFEYQLALINEPVAFRLLARHAVDCILNATRRRSRILDANALVRGVIRGRPPCVDGPMFVSVFVGQKELKWNLNELFKKPALRRELVSVNNGNGSAGCGSGVEANRLSASSGTGVPHSSSTTIAVNGGGEDVVDVWRTELYRTPWRYFTSSRCDPMRYGYRGQIVERDYVAGGYRLNSEDERFFQEEVTLRYDDFHRVYSPLRRLVGVDTLFDYCAEQQHAATGNGGHVGSQQQQQLITGLSDYVRRWVPGDSYSRDEVEISFRPLGVALAPDAILTATSPAAVVLMVQSAVERKQRRAASSVRAAVTDSGSSGREGGGGLSRAAIEVTRACDELSGRLQGEFNWTSTCDGQNGGQTDNGIEQRRNRSSINSTTADRTSTDV